MSTDTLRKDLLDTIEEMRQLLQVSEDADQLFELRLNLRELSRQADDLTNATLQTGTPAWISVAPWPKTGVKTITSPSERHQQMQNSRAEES